MRPRITNKAGLMVERVVSTLLTSLMMVACPLAGVASAEVDAGIAGEFGITYTIDGSGAYTSATGATIGGDKLLGVDVSEHDGEVDWDKLVGAGMDFAIIRCGFGGHDDEDGCQTDYDDAQFSRNVAECERLGIPYGIYLYSYATEPLHHSIQEANHAVRLARRCNPTLGVWYDIEEPRQARAIGGDWSNYVTIVDNFKTNVEDKTDYKVGVYSSKSYFDTYLSSSYFDDIPKWYAQWASEPDAGYDYLVWQAGGVIVDGRTFDFDVADELPTMTDDGDKGDRNAVVFGGRTVMQATPTPSWIRRSVGIDAARPNGGDGTQALEGIAYAGLVTSTTAAS